MQRVSRPASVRRIAVGAPSRPSAGPQRSGKMDRQQAASGGLSTSATPADLYGRAGHPGTPSGLSTGPLGNGCPDWPALSLPPAVNNGVPRHQFGATSRQCRRPCFGHWGIRCRASIAPREDSGSRGDRSPQFAGCRTIPNRPNPANFPRESDWFPRCDTVHIPQVRGNR